MSSPISTTTPGNNPHQILIPIRQWIQNKNEQNQVGWGHAKNDIIRKITVAYGISQLLLRAKEDGVCSLVIRAGCNLDNFAVKLSPENQDGLVLNTTVDGSGSGATNTMAAHAATSGWERIDGVDMISPPMSLHITTPFFSGIFFDEEHPDEMSGAFIEVEIESSLPINAGYISGSFNQSDENRLCHLFGMMLHEMFARNHPFGGSSPPSSNNSDCRNGFVDYLECRNLTRATSTSNPESNESCTPLLDLGFPSSLSLLVRHLLECGVDVDLRSTSDAYSSLQVAGQDLHLLVEHPNCFLFNDIPTDNNNVGLRSPTLKIRKDKLYGRKKEVDLITDAFCRVSLLGESEAVFIGGFSGCGKSRLAQRVMEHVKTAGGYVVTKKFDQMTQDNPMSVVISAFNDLCILLVEKNTPQHVATIVQELRNVFGQHLSILSRVLSNIGILSDELNVASAVDQNDSIKFNSNNVCFILQLFLRTVSSESRPVMLFLDDLQWADNVSLDLVHALLTDTKGSSSLLFVGSYRDDEVPPDHAIVLFKNDLIKCNVPPTEIHLDGLCKESLNSMISDALGCFPRLTQKSLSEIVHRKTKGNPFFALEFLGSLNRRGLLQFNSTEGRWIWDNDIIMAEDITDNVCHLLTTQMNGLSSGMQCAMKTASCFGTSIHLSFVGCLSAVEQYSTLMQDLDQAACDGFMNRVQTGYMFVHDKVREAAYGLIPVEERAQFHYNIGMLLYGMLNGQDLGDLLYPIIDQINYGSISLIVCPIHRISIAELNYDVAVKAMNSSYFKAAYLYLKRAVEMLPEGHWQSHHSLSRRFNLLLADASCACGNIDEATKCVNEILSECHSLDDKLDAYFTMANLFAIRNQGAKAYNLCEDVMSQLGETIPASFESTRLSQMVAESQRSLSLLTDSDIQGMREMEDQKQLVLMKFYNRISTASYYGRPDMFPYFACKIVELSLRHGVCKFSAKGFADYAIILGGKMNNHKESYRLGKIALSLLTRFRAYDQVTNVYTCFYGFIAVNTVPLQTCAEMLRRGYEMGMSLGSPADGFHAGIHYLHKAFASGKKLRDLNNHIECQLRMIKRCSFPAMKLFLTCFQEIILLLINKEKPAEFDEVVDDDASKSAIAESTVVHRTMQSFWVGHYDRCMFYADKSEAFTNNLKKLRAVAMSFYRGIAVLMTIGKKERKRNDKKTDSLKEVVMKSIQFLRSESNGHNWNHQNKLHLLEAGFYSYQKKKDKANLSYNAAIAMARSSGYIHEQGLACELAGMHYKKMGEKAIALSSFRQAIRCYTEWGSQVRVDMVTRQMELLEE